MLEKQPIPYKLSPPREAQYREFTNEPPAHIPIDRLGVLVENVPYPFSEVVGIDMSGIDGCHYGVKNIFPSIFYRYETQGLRVGEGIFYPTPDKAIAGGTTTTNAGTAMVIAAERFGYEPLMVIPDNLPRARYRFMEDHNVHLIKTRNYAKEMPDAVKALIAQNPERLARGEKVYMFEDHSVRNADITVEVMSKTIGSQVVKALGHLEGLALVVAMGNGSSIQAIGQEVRMHIPESKVVAAESIAYGGGYNMFAAKNHLPTYRDLLGIDPGHPELMKVFRAYGSNAPIHVKLPLQQKSIDEVVTDYALYLYDEVLAAYQKLGMGNAYSIFVESLPNYDRLPKSLYERYGNTSLANILIASQYVEQGLPAAAVLYDSRINY